MNFLTVLTNMFSQLQQHGYSSHPFNSRQPVLESNNKFVGRQVVVKVGGADLKRRERGTSN